MRTVDPRLWTDPAFQALSPEAKLIFLCWATGPVDTSGHTTQPLTGLSDAQMEAVWKVADALSLFPGKDFEGGTQSYKHVSRHSHPPAVYFIKSGDDGLIKIGWTNDVDSRLATLQTGSPEVLSLLALVIGAQADERRLHQKFAHLRVRGEWFQDCAEIREYIRAIGRGEVEELA
jgi:hypothetical protein